MSSSYHVSPSAAKDLADIWNYIALDDVVAADQLVTLFETHFQQLAEMPGIGRNRPELSKGFRSMAVGNYLIFYTIGANEIEIVRVLHGARNLRRLFANLKKRTQ